MGHRRQIRRIGFQKKAACSCVAHTGRRDTGIFVRDHAGKRYPVAVGDEGRGRLPSSEITMELRLDPATAFLDQRHHIVPATVTPMVHNHRQSTRLGQIELRPKNRRLPGFVCLPRDALRRRVEIVEPALANRHHLLVAAPQFQLLPPPVIGQRSGLAWVDANRHKHPWMPLGQGQGARPVLQIRRGHNQPMHARGRRARHHRILLAGKPPAHHMTMTVGPMHASPNHTSLLPARIDVGGTAAAGEADPRRSTPVVPDCGRPSIVPAPFFAACTLGRVPNPRAMPEFPVLLATWLNDLNPVALRITDSVQVRWYGLAYVAGFLAAWLVMRWMARTGRSVLPESEMADFVTFTALFGVMLGGRLGYMVLYDSDRFFANPLTFFQLGQGGMASHGGILGIIAFTWVYARIKKVSWPGLGDLLVVGAPLGILFGRIANFINGELWGHRAGALPWAVKFPQEALDSRAYPALADATYARIEAVAGPQALEKNTHEHLARLLRADDPVLRPALEAALPPRHPSQLYEAALEGLLLFLILFAIARHPASRRPGWLTGWFFILYGAFRIIGEIWRVPDARGLSWLAPLSPGQQYSLPMLAIGAAFLWHAARSGRRDTRREKTVAASGSTE
jgi:phosphatidylglycerol---prolipoprotein diacylglyceryl transferase